ncbi:hypothetical protein J1N35_023217 [Gossypium stocksii]|uniref:Uncharacterized protein n=1 Tax=Gossypium stocksii TaxID=47602 RepID=A0A9D3VIC7_9ROSI|nr:hypothetical protein J1N35_023217 [Gossypium stocksii]
MTSKFEKLHERLDRLEERAQRERTSPSQRTETRSSRKQTSNDYLRRGPYRDSYSTRTSIRNNSSFKFEAYYGDKREGLRNPSYTPNVLVHRESNPSYTPNVFKDSSDKFQLHYLPDERRFHLIEKCKVEDEIIPQVLKGKQGDKSKWYLPKEGGYANNLLPFQTIYGSWVFGNDFVRLMNKRVCDLESFFATKWPDLRVIYLQEGGYDAIPVASCFKII